MSSEAGQEQRRKLAAIMFTDIVGYSALTQDDEARALEVLERHNRLLIPSFPKYHGREVKRIGDSFLVEFDSALDAVNCALDIQKSLHDYNLSTHDEKWKIRIRIGIHLGDVVRKDDDIFGDAVNIASRIEPLAEAGGVCISQQVFDQIQNKLSQPLSKLPQASLKNIQFPIDVYKLEMPWELGMSTTISRSSKERIAILPFVNMSPDPSDEFFADGLTEELISKLSLVKGLRIIARTSVMRYKNKDKGISDIGKELAVSYVVEGSVRKAGNRIRVTAQLIDTESEEHLWASSYDKDLDDIFAVQTDVATKISESLLGNLVTIATQGISRGETTNLTAWSYYMRGKQLMNERSDDSLQKALELFTSANKLDPSFARAYIEAGNCYAYLGMRSTISFEEALNGMKTSAQRALEIDQQLAEVHTLLSLIAWVEDDHVRDEQEALKAIELNPSLAEAHLRLSYVKSSYGYLKDSVSILERALLLDPLSSDIVGSLGMEYFWSGREKDALDLWNRSRRILPYVVANNMFEYYLEKRDFERAEDQVKILESFPGGASYHSVLRRTELYALKGDREATEKAIDILVKSFKGTAANDRNVGFVRYYLGDKDGFFAAMFRAVESHVLDTSRLRYSFLLEEARKDPRYHEVLRKNGCDRDSQE